tara:strand:- start:1285 stop:1404 length:120 start_codon:yes stop_codon:yes gene_type:complete
MSACGGVAGERVEEVVGERVGEVAKNGTGKGRLNIRNER